MKVKKVHPDIGYGLGFDFGKTMFAIGLFKWPWVRYIKTATFWDLFGHFMINRVSGTFQIRIMPMGFMLKSDILKLNYQKWVANYDLTVDIPAMDIPCGEI